MFAWLAEQVGLAERDPAVHERVQQLRLDEDSDADTPPVRRAAGSPAASSAVGVAGTAVGAGVRSAAQAVVAGLKQAAGWSQRLGWETQLVGVAVLCVVRSVLQESVLGGALGVAYTVYLWGVWTQFVWDALELPWSQIVHEAAVWFVVQNQGLARDGRGRGARVRYDRDSSRHTGALEEHGAAAALALATGVGLGSLVANDYLFHDPELVVVRAAGAAVVERWVEALSLGALLGVVVAQRRVRSRGDRGGSELGGDSDEDGGDRWAGRHAQALQDSPAVLRLPGPM
eukprot:TRINITY_DN3624_c0_g1_i5.p4 TRINITY_DN3624_c0_g1~~TRINITY_DN3624_c0_g1_i5.p4  ORF type:complete len:287 (-),score=55.60 TRINITY_DN3624_c0_g1_i5:28-888(-)